MNSKSAHPQEEAEGSDLRKSVEGNPDPRNGNHDETGVGREQRSEHVAFEQSRQDVAVPRLRRNLIC